MSGVSEFLPRSIPKFLDENNEEVIFKEGIDAREKFYSFYKMNMKNIISSNLSKSLNLIEKNTTSTTFIAGSRAWNHYIKNECNDNIIPELSLLEQNSILPGNYDIFCICTNKNQIDDIYKEICICFDKIISEIYDNKSVASSYSLTYISNVGKDVTSKNKQKISSHKFYAKHLERYCPLNTEFSSEGCVFPACKAMHLELTYDPSDNNVKKLSGDFDGKVLLYFEVIYIPGDESIDVINKQLLSQCNNSKLKYLNLTGLYLFNELILNRNKEYDVDLNRKRILDKILVKGNIDPFSMYIKILGLYKQLFFSRSDYSFKLSLLLKHFIDLCNKDLMSSFTSYITETFRPYINTFVSEIDQHLREMNSYIFVTGGDAYRRYIDDIKKTNDLDTKVFYKNEEDKKSLINFLTLKLSELVTILYSNKNNIFKRTSDVIPLGRDNITVDVKFKPVYHIKDDDEQEAGQFRLRLIDKDDLTLFSIDYRTKIHINIKAGNLIINTNINHDIPILDLVLAHSKLNSNFVVQYSNGLPVASSQYLQKDLRDIYTEVNKNLLLRFHKSSKDKHRFISLINYLKKTKDLLKGTGNIRLKRKIEDVIPDDIEELYKRRKEDIIMKDILKHDDDMDLDLNLHNINIANFQNYPKIFTETLDVRFIPGIYGNSLIPHRRNIKNYADKLLTKIDKNLKLDKEIREEKLQLSFNDIYDVFKDDDMIIDLFSKLVM